MLGKLIKQSCSGFRGRRRPLPTCDPAWTARLLAHLTIAASKSSGTYHKRGSGSWNFLSPGDLASPPGSGKSCDSPGEINSIVTIEPELHFCTQTDNISLRPGIINGSPQDSILKSHLWGGRTAQDPSQLGLQRAVTRDFPAAVWIWK